jgi:hypothetical protein
MVTVPPLTPEAAGLGAKATVMVALVGISAPPQAASSRVAENSAASGRMGFDMA